MKKGFVDFIVFTSIIVTLMSAVDNYLRGGSYNWHAVSLTWMIAYYVAYRESILTDRKSGSK